MNIFLLMLILLFSKSELNLEIIPLLSNTQEIAFESANKSLNNNTKNYHMFDLTDLSFSNINLGSSIFHNPNGNTSIDDIISYYGNDYILNKVDYDYPYENSLTFINFNFGEFIFVEENDVTNLISVSIFFDDNTIPSGIRGIHKGQSIEEVLSCFVSSEVIQAVLSDRNKVHALYPKNKDKRYNAELEFTTEKETNAYFSYKINENAYACLNISFNDDILSFMSIRLSKYNYISFE